MASPEVINIGEIDHHDITTDTIKIEGVVNKIVPLLDRKGVEIKDQTGSIWVITNNTAKVGDRLVIEGILKYQEIIMDKEKYQDFYLQEISEKESENN